MFIETTVPAAQPDSRTPDSWRHSHFGRCYFLVTGTIERVGDISHIIYDGPHITALEYTDIAAGPKTLRLPARPRMVCGDEAQGPRSTRLISSSKNILPRHLAVIYSHVDRMLESGVRCRAVKCFVDNSGVCLSNQMSRQIWVKGKIKNFVAKT